MATVARSASSGRSSKNSARTKCNAHNQDLGFLDNFSSDDYSSQSSVPNSTDHKTSEESSEEESDYDYEYEDRRRTNKIKRGTVYTVGLLIAWCMFSAFTRSPGIVALILLVLGGPNEDVPSSISTMLQSYFGQATSALERKQEQRRNIPISRTPPEFLFDPTVKPDDPYWNVHPDWQDRRLWGESLRDIFAWPHMRSDILTSAQKLLRVVRSIFIFQATLQFAFTLAQTLGVHYRHGHDTIGLFARYWANLCSSTNLFGAGGLAAVTAHYEFVFGWWRDWFVGIATLLVWELPRAVVLAMWWVCSNAIKAMWIFALRGDVLRGEPLAADAWGKRDSEVT